MFGLTPLGTLHTLISLVALAAGVACLIRHGSIRPDIPMGRAYVWATVVTCITGFGIFQHGGFGPPHVLGLLTLVALGVAAWPGGARLVGERWRYVVTVLYSLTLFFHCVPGVTETFTRLPVGQPLFTGPDDPALRIIVGVLFVIFLGGATWQVMQLRRTVRAAGLRTVPEVGGQAS